MILLYMDESGNTGSNWLDSRQPYFIYGGWILLENKKDEAINLMSKIFANYQGPEFKSTNIWRRRQEQLLEFINRMIREISAIPFLGIVDKNYMVAGKIVETFFDPSYNPNINNCFTYPLELKIALASSLSKNEELISNFGVLIQQGAIGIEQMRDIKKRLQMHFKEISIEASDSIDRLCDEHLAKMIEEFEIVSNSGIEKKSLSLVQPIFFERILHFDRFCTLADDSGSIYVDQLHNFTDVFNNLKSINDNVKSSTNDIDIIVCDSKVEKLIQAADLLVGFVSKSFKEIHDVKNIKTFNDLWKLFISIDAQFAMEDIVILQTIGSDVSDSIAELAGFPKPKRENLEHLIKKDFLEVINT